jgi:lysyl-tRNA synthetase class 2
MSVGPSWWRPDIHADRRPFLLGRARIQAALRRWFDARGFIEVDPCILQASPGNEAHLHAFATDLAAVDGTGRGRLYLHTSPEFACKKLLAAGETRLFTFAHVFRNRERGPLHHPEFTMLEWYRAAEPYEALMSDCAEILGIAAAAGGVDLFEFRGRTVDPLATPERLTVGDAFRRLAAIDLMATVDVTGTTDRAALAEAVRVTGGRVADDDSWADLFSRILVERIEPAIGNGRATFLCEYPVAEAALARAKPDDPRVAERFELFACGVELANAFGELTDAAEQRRRFSTEMDLKERLYGERYPLDEDFLAALAQMPPASGIALGFDRLVMLATGAPTIAHVLWAPVPDRI